MVGSVYAMLMKEGEEEVTAENLPKTPQVFLNSLP
jgi:hypothetical protein